MSLIVGPSKTGYPDKIYSDISVCFGNNSDGLDFDFCNSQWLKFLLCLCEPCVAVTYRSRDT